MFKIFQTSFKNYLGDSKKRVAKLIGLSIGVQITFGFNITY